MVKLVVSAFLNICRMNVVGVTGPYAVSENRILPAGTAPVHAESHRYLKSAAQVPNGYTLDPSTMMNNVPPRTSRTQAMRAIKLQGLMRCHSMAGQIHHVLCQFGRNGGRNAHSSASYELDKVPGGNLVLRTTSTAAHAGQGGGGGLSNDRNGMEINKYWNSAVARFSWVAGKARDVLIAPDEGDNADNLYQFTVTMNLGGQARPLYSSQWSRRFAQPVLYDGFPEHAWLSWDLNPLLGP